MSALVRSEHVNYPKTVLTKDEPPRRVVHRGGSLAEYVRQHSPVPPEVLAYLSPALMEHVNQYGTYTFPIEKVLAAKASDRCARPKRAVIPVLDWTTAAGENGQ